MEIAVSIRPRLAGTSLYGVNLLKFLDSLDTKNIYYYSSSRLLNLSTDQDPFPGDNPMERKERWSFVGLCVDNDQYIFRAGRDEIRLSASSTDTKKKLRAEKFLEDLSAIISRDEFYEIEGEDTNIDGHESPLTLTRVLSIRRIHGGIPIPLPDGIT